ncbi:MAG: CapA family protein [Bacteroidales bacterium]|jgi:poly-gamma-glutamate synthesis protein (capsule biosynthesis protein)|nr:CapA family protein [Bacteroidales bacterium]
MKKAGIMLLLCGAMVYAVILVLPQPVAAEEPETPSRADHADTVRLIFAGDVMGHGMQITGAWHDGGDTAYNYHPVFQYVKEYIMSADAAFANLEVTLARAPYTGYPQFSSHFSLASALQDAGFDVLTTANNHSLDRGKQGLERTIDVLDSIGMAHTGTFKDSAAWSSDYPLQVERNGFKFALLNYTYGTNGFATESPNVINRIDTIRMAADLAKAASLQPDGVIAFLHWGEEYKNTENTIQRQLSGFLARHGCHLIVGAHPHVVQPFDKIPTANGDSVPVIYSMGNFVSNQRDRYRNGGIALDVVFVKTADTLRMISCGYEPFWVYRFRHNGVSVFRLIPINDAVLHPEKYNIDGENQQLMMLFYNDTRQLLSRLPFSGYFRTDTIPR